MVTARQAMVDDGALELLVLLTQSWDEGVQEEAAIALTHYAHRPQNRMALVRAGALPPLIEQLSSSSSSVRFHAALALAAMS